MFRKLRNWLTWKETTLKHIKVLEEVIKEKIKIIDFNLKPFIDKIQELEQNKGYHIRVENKEQAKAIDGILEEIRHRIPWTLPTMVVSDFDIKQLTTKQVEYLRKKLKGKK